MNKKIIICNILVATGAIGLYIIFLMTSPVTSAFSDSEIAQYHSNGKALVIKPLLTATAYQNGGFYDYYSGKCGNECLTSPINETARYGYTSSQRGIEVLGKMGYPMITDSYLESNPSIIYQYDTVILLHSEYVTKKTFNIITHHPRVIYLYPNSLYAEIEIKNGTMTLIRGHHYPDQSISNGFGWEHDNHDDEFDDKCDHIQWRPIKNGWQLNCYPENSFYNNRAILGWIREHS